MDDINMGGVQASNDMNETGISSCEINSSTKGVLTFKVKVYDKDIDKATEKVIIKAMALKELCDAKSTTPK